MIAFYTLYDPAQEISAQLKKNVYVSSDLTEGEMMQHFAGISTSKPIELGLFLQMFKNMYNIEEGIDHIVKKLNAEHSPQTLTPSSINAVINTSPASKIRRTSSIGSVAGRPSSPARTVGPSRRSSTSESVVDRSRTNYESVVGHKWTLDRSKKYFSLIFNHLKKIDLPLNFL